MAVKSNFNVEEGSFGTTIMTHKVLLELPIIVSDASIGEFNTIEDLNELIKELSPKKLNITEAQLDEYINTLAMKGK